VAVELGLGVGGGNSSPRANSQDRIMSTSPHLVESMLGVAQQGSGGVHNSMTVIHPAAPPGWGVDKDKTSLSQVPEAFWSTVSPHVHSDIANYFFELQYDQAAYLKEQTAHIQSSHAHKIQSSTRSKEIRNLAFGLLDKVGLMSKEVWRGPGAAAVSRWWQPDGECVWRPCKVMSVDNEGIMFSIEWAGNGRKKVVSRLNILFQGEQEQMLDQVMFAARAMHNINIQSAAESERERQLLMKEEAAGNSCDLPDHIVHGIVMRLGLRPASEAVRSLEAGPVVQGGPGALRAAHRASKAALSSTSPPPHLSPHSPGRPSTSSEALADKGSSPPTGQRAHARRVASAGQEPVSLLWTSPPFQKEHKVPPYADAAWPMLDSSGSVVGVTAWMGYNPAQP
jgi:hypothetical protein